MKKQFLFLLLLLLALPLAAQNVRVTGVVSSADDNEPLIGATVQVKENPAVGVSTNIDGEYTIDVKVGQTLKFTYVGCDTELRKVTEAGTINVSLRSSNMLDEVVAIGYGTMKKSDLTGSVSSVASDKLQKTPSASLANALQGQAAGVTVNSLTGRPGASAEVRIRGVGTINGSSPIYVVDGVIVDDISFLSPADIQSTEILKDASAAAIYGARGANGVILVTTKTGKKADRANITFDMYVGWESRHKKLDVMGAKDFADTYVAINGNTASKKYYAENGLNKWLGIYSGLKASDYYPTIYDPETNPTGINYEGIDTDWQDEVFRTGMIQNYHLSIDGGSDQFTYSMSGSWFKQEGTLIGSDYSRLTARLNTSYQATPWMKVGENISFMAGVARNAFESGDNSSQPEAGILAASFAMAPWDPTHYPAGTVNRKGKEMGGLIAASSNYKNVTNPFSMVEYSHPKRNNSRFVGNAFIELTPIKGLTWRTTYGFDYNVVTDKSFSDAYEVSAFDKRDKNFLSSSINKYYNWNVDNILTYARTIGDHSFSVMAGQTVEEYSMYGIGNSGAMILNPVERNWYLSQTTENNTNPASDSVARNRRFSWLGRVYYSYMDKYMATVNFRADGSSKFPENSWGYFPSFSLAWRASGEEFLKNVDWLNDLKVRFGWGKVGNDNIGNNAFTLSVANAGPYFLGYAFGQPQTLVQGATVLTWVNNGGHWENTEQFSAGIDFGMFSNRLTGSVDGFIRKTNDMLMNVTAPAHVGNRWAATANVGNVRNQGIEISLEHRNQIGKDFSYSVGGNISFIDNKLTAVNGGSANPINEIQYIEEGHPLYYFKGYQYLGVFKTDEEANAFFPGYAEGENPFHAGDAIYADLDGDGKNGEGDRTDLGSAIPWLTYGLNLGAYYKDFDIQLFFQGVGGNKIYNAQRSRLEGTGMTSALSPVMKDVWTVDNPDGSIPNPKNSFNTSYPSSRFLESGSYFRLKNLQIGYSLPEKLISRAGFKACRVYLQGSNLFTATKYKGFDPEVNGGVDNGNYPQSRTFLIGVNISY